MRLKKLLMPLVLALLNLGCTHAVTKSSGRNWRDANIHKVVIVCIQADRMTNRRIEFDMVPNFKRQGFSAIAAQDLFPGTSEYSPKDLLDRMQRAQVDGIMEIAFSGQAPADRMSREVKFKYHAFKSLTVKFPDRRRPLDSALIALIGA